VSTFFYFGLLLLYTCGPCWCCFRLLGGSHSRLAFFSEFVEREGNLKFLDLGFSRFDPLHQSPPTTTHKHTRTSGRAYSVRLQGSNSCEGDDGRIDRRRVRGFTNHQSPSSLPVLLLPSTVPVVHTNSYQV
jgi:hypothetical protein